MNFGILKHSDVTKLTQYDFEGSVDLFRLRKVLIQGSENL